MVPYSSHRYSIGRIKTEETRREGLHFSSLEASPEQSLHNLHALTLLQKAFCSQFMQILRRHLRASSFMVYNVLNRIGLSETQLESRLPSPVG
jgi:hypothetical protein